MNLTDQWRQSATDHAAKGSRELVTGNPDLGRGYIGIAAAYTDCANQLDEWMTGLRTLLDSWDDQVRRKAHLLTRSMDDHAPGPVLDAIAGELNQLQRCTADLRKLMQTPRREPGEVCGKRWVAEIQLCPDCHHPARDHNNTTPVPVEDQCGEGPHGQPCGQRVDHGVCPDHGEVGP